MTDTTVYFLVTLGTTVGGLFGFAASRVLTKITERREARFYVEWTPADDEWLDTWGIIP